MTGEKTPFGTGEAIGDIALGEKGDVGLPTTGEKEPATPAVEPIVKLSKGDCIDIPATDGDIGDEGENGDIKKSSAGSNEDVGEATPPERAPAIASGDKQSVKKLPLSILDLNNS